MKQYPDSHYVGHEKVLKGIQEGLLAADDYLVGKERLSDLYPGIPPELDCEVRTVELHYFPKQLSEQIKVWLAG